MKFLKVAAFWLFGSNVAMLSGPLCAQTTADWAVGSEREISAGSYVTLVDQFEGWHLWREDWKTGHSCSASKAAKGAVKSAMPLYYYAGGYPAVVISVNNSLIVGPHDHWKVIGRYLGDPDEKYRMVGERFFAEQPDLSSKPVEWESFFALDGKTIEVNVETWLYPAIYVGRSEERGLVDLTGLSNALRRVKECNQS